MAWWIFQNLVITTVLAAAVALVCRAGRIGPVARHALWVLVLVKFITPPVVVWPWAAPDPFALAAPESPATRTDVRSIEPGFSAPIEAVAVVGERMTPSIGLVENPRATAHAATPVWPWLIGLWAFGSAFILGIEVFRLVRLTRRVRSMPGDHPVARRVQALAAQLEIRPVSVDIVDGISSPVVWGWGRPRLLWPAALDIDHSDASLDGIVVHELAHIKRGDHFVGWIELVAGVVWWWNPLFWSVRSARREQAELACDAWVISALPNGRRAYAESLLLLSGAIAPDPSPMTAVGIRPGSRRVLERRLVMIMKGRTSLRLHWVGLSCMGLVAAATLPAWASASQQPPPPHPAPAVPVVVTRTMPDPPHAAPAPPQVKTRQVPPPPERVGVEKAPTVHTTKIQPPQIVKTMPRGTYTVHYRAASNLPADGKELLDKYEADAKAIQEEINQKLEARRANAVKELEALQEKYTKDGKLDEAVAIRDYLRAGGPGSPAIVRYTATSKGGR